ncbi:MAG: VOC family protein, partial [Candidatus Thermoplasmatota archaeon]|nr:VOC family protein [Candidatus Thermoplasmatota archaeon]
MVVLEHVAIECDTVDHAKQFYENVLGCSLAKSFDLPIEFTEQVFSLKKEVKALVYKGEIGIFEVFITEESGNKTLVKGFSHVCISVDNIKEFFVHCEENGLRPFTVEKNKK